MVGKLGLEKIERLKHRGHREVRQGVLTKLGAAVYNVEGFNFICHDGRTVWSGRLARCGRVD
jgi:hypothetical protein